MPLKTALYDRHVALGGRMVEFGGWLLPVQYEGVLAEHRHCRSSAVVFDTSHMGQLLFRGGDAAGQLGRICTQDAAGLRVGRCRYGFLLNEEAGVIDDTILMRLGEEEFLLVVNAATAEGDLAWVVSHLSGGVEAANRSAEGSAKMDLQGPLAAKVLRPLVDADLGQLGYFGVAACRCCGVECILSRTGYTGELGYEIMAGGEEMPGIFDRLLEHEAVRPAGLGARDSLRLEMCYPLYGHELSPRRSPIEAGLEMFLDLRREFAGVERLREVAEHGPRQQLAAFRAASRRRAGPGNTILADGRAVGEVTSGAFSPSLEVSVGMGYVEAPWAKPQTELTVDTGRAELSVRVCEKPLYRQGTCRTKDL